MVREKHEDEEDNEKHSLIIHIRVVLIREAAYTHTSEIQIRPDKETVRTSRKI